MFINHRFIGTPMPVRSRPAGQAWLPVVVLLALMAPGFAQVRTQREQENSSPPQPAPPVIANICPRFVLQGVARRIKFYGAYFADPRFEYEGDDLEFRDFRVDPDARSFTVTVESKREAMVGKRQLKLVGQNEMSREVTLYVLKPQDRAILQRDLVRCPAMKDEVELPEKPGAQRSSKPPE